MSHSLPFHRLALPLVALYCLLTATNMYGQHSSDTIFYNRQWDTTTRAQARFFRTGTYLKDGLYHVTDRHINGRPQMTGTFKSLVPELKQGKFVYYDSLGMVEVEEQFVNGMIQGNRIVYHDHSKAVNSRTMFKDNERNGEMTTYFKTGKVAGRLNFKNGLLHGSSTWYYPSGKVASNIAFRGKDSIAQFTQYDTAGAVVLTVTPLPSDPVGDTSSDGPLNTNTPPDFPGGAFDVQR